MLLFILNSIYVMKIKTKVQFRKIANTVAVFHGAWILMVFIGTIVELFYPAYAPIQFSIIIGTGLFQLLGRGHCPLTLLENLLWEKCDPKKMYCDTETYSYSFIRHYTKKFTGWELPVGTTSGLIIFVITITTFVLFRPR